VAFALCNDVSLPKACDATESQDMTSSQSVDAGQKDLNSEAEAEELDFKPLTAEQAQVLRQRHVAVSPWRVLGLQGVAGVVVAFLAWLVSGRVAGLSAAYGALAVVMPVALFTRGVTGGLAKFAPGSAMVMFFVWELVKVALTIAMLFAAPRLVPGLSWLALLAGFVVTMKVVWLALMFRAKRPHSARTE
jgi:ATP synthase protein I